MFSSALGRRFPMRNRHVAVSSALFIFKIALLKCDAFITQQSENPRFTWFGSGARFYSENQIVLDILQLAFRDVTLEHLRRYTPPAVVWPKRPKSGYLKYVDGAQCAPTGT